MPPEGNTQVAVVSFRAATDTGASVVFEIGARGVAVELIAIHYQFSGGWLPDANRQLFIGLSSNPVHQQTPPVSIDQFLVDRAVYGIGYHHFLQVLTVEGARTILLETLVIPLYGLVRPRRQILVATGASGGAIQMRAEVYYRPTSLSRVDLDTLNLKYGKYRRGA